MSYSRQELKESFDSFDADNNGAIDFEEFKAFLSELDPEIQEAEMEIGFEIVDQNHNDEIEFEEFIAWWTES